MAILLVIVCSLVITLPRCIREKRDPMTLSTVTVNLAGLVYTAEQRSLFQKNGLSAVVKKYVSGPLALKDLEERKADAAAMADFAFVSNGLGSGNVKVIGTIGKGGGVQIVARRDSGIAKPADLVGKTIAVPKGTVAQFFLGAYCQRNGVPYDKVRVVFMSPQEIMQAIGAGTINAACLWSPFVEQIRDHLGYDVTLLPSDGRTDFYLLLVTRDDVLRDRPAAVERLLRTMIDAETFIRQHPDEAMQVVARETGLTIDQVRRGWPENRFEVRLDQELLTVMEAEAHWMIRNHLTEKKEMPNLLEVIDLKPLGTVKPDAVGIMH